MKKVRLLRIIATIWLTIFVVIFTIGMIGILITKGVGEALRIMSPFNIVGFVVNIISISPALILYWLANKLEHSKKP